MKPPFDAKAEIAKNLALANTDITCENCGVLLAICRAYDLNQSHFFCFTCIAARVPPSDNSPLA